MFVCNGILLEDGIVNQSDHGIYEQSTSQNQAWDVELEGRTQGFSLVFLLMQTFPTTPGQKYVARFALAGSPAKHLREKTLDAVVTVADVKRTIRTPPGKDSISTLWETHTLEFSATGEKTTIRFEDLDSKKTSFGILLDNVAVVPAGAPIPLSEPDYDTYTVEYV